MNKKILLCEDSLDGIFTGIYEAWLYRNDSEAVKLAVVDQGTMELFAEYQTVLTDAGKAARVSRTLRERLGEEAFEAICQAAAAADERKADAIFRVAAIGLGGKNGHRVMDALGVPAVHEVFSLSRQVGNEIGHYLQFIRFREMKGGILFSVIEPRSNLLPFIAPHFADRLCRENWVIQDKNRGLFVLHRGSAGWILVSGEQVDPKWLEESGSEEENFQKLWKGFTKSISVEARENYRLQRQNLPLRFRNHMVEFVRE